MAGEAINNRIARLLGQSGFGAVYLAWDCCSRSRAKPRRAEISWYSKINPGPGEEVSA